MKPRPRLPVLGTLAVMAVMAVLALAMPAHAAPEGAGKRTAPGASSLATGVVVEVDLKAQTAVIDHGPLRSLGMDPMAMEFKVPDRQVLATLKPGDRIRFAATWKDGDYIASRIQVSKPRKAAAKE
jgi:Cu(I)/Ag(I) efflux system protein CusF